MSQQGHCPVDWFFIRRSLEGKSQRGQYRTCRKGMSGHDICMNIKCEQKKNAYVRFLLNNLIKEQCSRLNQKGLKNFKNVSK